MAPHASPPSPPRLASDGTSGGRARRARISLTPLIDVVFILLVFFMLASSFLDWRAIDLSPARTSTGGGMEGAVLVEVVPEGVRLGGKRLAPAELAARVRELLAEDADRRVLVRPAPSVPLQRAVGVLDRLSAAGVAELSMIRAPAR